MIEPSEFTHQEAEKLDRFDHQMRIDNNDAARRQLHIEHGAMAE